MPLSQADRISFSGQIVGSVAQIAGISKAQSQVASGISALQSLDTANANLFTAPNLLVNGYQAELSMLDGNGRTTITEQNIQDAGNKKLQNYFFPNDTTVTVPSLASANNVWTQPDPFALNYAIGKNYTESYASVANEPQDISAITTIITNAQASWTDLELTTGEAPAPGTCSLPSYTTEATCVAGGGMWTPGVGNVPSPAIEAIQTNLLAAVNALITFLNAEAAAIVTTDKTAPNQANNAAAVSNINTVIIPALNTWAAYPPFESTGSGPSQLHVTQLTALTTALSTRSTFITTRIGQLNTVLGTITQVITTGAVSGSGLYLTRYNYLKLRLNLLSGSLSQLLGAQNASKAQTAIAANITGASNTYSSILPTTALAANANGTQTISVSDASAYSVGDSVFVMADNQTELQRAIKAISGKMVTLNDVIPAKYTTDINARMYKDLS